VRKTHEATWPPFFSGNRGDFSVKRADLRCAARCAAVISWFYFFAAVPAGLATIRYDISLAHPEQHIFHVTMEIPEVSGEVIVQLPAWNALYQIRDFSSHVRQVEAFAEDKTAPLEKLDKQTWKIKGNGTVKLQYAAYWDEPGPFSTQLNRDHAFFNPAMILFYVPARRGEAVQLTVTDAVEGWKAASAAVTPGIDSGNKTGFYFAAVNYDQLADAPVELSNFVEFALPGLSPRVRVVIHGDNWKKSEVQDQLKRICQYEIKLMDGAPYREYTFIFHIGHAAAGGGGGMEHADSTAIYAPSADSLANVSAHEFFHLWNVKRIRPTSLEPVDYTKEQYSRALWFAEGVTSTYGRYALLRSGLWNKQGFYEDLSQQISELATRPAEKWQSAEQSSLDAWLEKYSLYNSPESSVSYYTKGQVLGVLLDLIIRERTDNSRSLDDVLRAMNAEFARKGTFYRDSVDIQLTAEKIAGVSLDDFFRKYVAGAEPLPYSEIFAAAGLELRQMESKRTMLGFAVRRAANGILTIESVSAENAAATAKLKSGDEILSWNGETPPRKPEQWAEQRKAGELLRLRMRREDREQTVEFPLSEVKEIVYQVAESAHAGERAKRVREGLLRGTTSPETAKRN
jgi:predicted metalloprotease with PDZ domain